jgi:hypothetical protein
MLVRTAFFSGRARTFKDNTPMQESRKARQLEAKKPERKKPESF